MSWLLIKNRFFRNQFLCQHSLSSLTTVQVPLAVVSRRLEFPIFTKQMETAKRIA